MNATLAPSRAADLTAAPVGDGPAAASTGLPVGVLVGLIWAQAHDRVIGANGAMPWHLPEDLAHFAAVTAGAAVVMGRSTWESLPAAVRPLPGRRNIVLTRSTTFAGEGALVARSVAEALELAGPGRVWGIGGAQVYEQLLPWADSIWCTDVALDVAGDTRAPALAAGAWATVTRAPLHGWACSRTGLRYAIRELHRIS